MWGTKINTSAVMFTLVWPTQLQPLYTDVYEGLLVLVTHKTICSCLMSAAVMQLINTRSCNLRNKTERSVSRTLSVCLSKHVIFYKGNQTLCKLLLVRRQNAQWTFSEFLFGLSFKWKFASQWCAEVQQNGILDWINPCVADRQKYPVILCERLMSEPITGDRAVICSVIYKWC